MDILKNNLDKAKKEAENFKRSNENARINNDQRKQYETFKTLANAEEKCQRIDKELDEANATVNEKYDKYTESLYKKVSDEYELANNYLDVRNHKIN